jgi:hypothetical protein
MRGNHDTYDEPHRGGPADPFALYGWSAHVMASKRSYVHDLRDGSGASRMRRRPGPHVLRAQPRAAFDAQDLHAQCLLVAVQLFDCKPTRCSLKVAPQLQVHAGCIAAQIVVLDGTPDTGYRSFLNFFTNFRPADIAAAHDALEAAAARAQQSRSGTQCSHLRGERAPLLVALHHPLSVSQYPGPAGAPASSQFSRLHELLAYHRASLVVSGHLHDAFGPRLHGFHRLQTFAGDVEAPRLLEAESADWKFRRRFRLLTLQHGASFTDLRFIVDHSSTAAGTAADPDGPGSLDVAAKPWRVQYEDASAVAGPYVVHIVDPPDARYFPAQSGSTAWELRHVEALLIWARDLQADGSNALQPRLPNATAAVVSCMDRAGRRAWVQRVPMALEQGASSDVAVGGTCPGTWPLHALVALPEHALQDANECQARGHALHLQVFADGGQLGLAASERRPIRASVQPGMKPLPMGTTIIESSVASADISRVAAGLYIGCIAAVMLLLAATCMARRVLLRANKGLSGARQHLGHTRETWTCQRAAACRTRTVKCRGTTLHHHDGAADVSDADAANMLHQVSTAAAH